MHSSGRDTRSSQEHPASAPPTEAARVPMTNGTRGRRHLIVSALLIGGLAGVVFALYASTLADAMFLVGLPLAAMVLPLFIRDERRQRRALQVCGWGLLAF